MWEAMMGSAASSAGSSIVETGMDALFGKDPAKEGLDAMNTMFPGTTPHERLGSPGGAASAALGASDQKSKRESLSQARQIERQNDIKQDEIDNAKEINDDKVAADVFTSENNLEAARLNSEATKYSADQSRAATENTKVPTGKLVEGVGGGLQDIGSIWKNAAMTQKQGDRYKQALIKKHGFWQGMKYYNAQWNDKGKFIPKAYPIID